MAFGKGVMWFSENKKAAMELHRLKLELQRGNTARVELKAREWLELCKERGWAKKRTLV